LGILKAAKESGKNFRVIVVDSRPKLEGRSLLKKLVALEIPTCYVLLNALSFVIKDVSLSITPSPPLFFFYSSINRIPTDPNK